MHSPTSHPIFDQDRQCGRWAVEYVHGQRLGPGGDGGEIVKTGLGGVLPLGDGHLVDEGGYTVTCTTLLSLSLQQPSNPTDPGMCVIVSSL